jgi:hypothetical protein
VQILIMLAYSLMHGNEVEEGKNTAHRRRQMPRPAVAFISLGWA